jgi:hypothetical protein
MVQQTTLPRPPLPPRAGQSPAKRPRALTALDQEPTLPPRHRHRAPPLKDTNAFMFTGLHPLYSRHPINEDHSKMEIRCTQQDCTYTKIINRSLSGTNNYQVHYRKQHPGIPTTKQEAIDAKEKRAQELGKSRVGFFDKPSKEQTHNERYRTLLLQWIIKNNLSFSIVDQPETKELFGFLNPSIKLVSRKTLMDDLKKRYTAGENTQRDFLIDHIEDGGRIALTTDAWSGNNKKDYMAVTAHGKTHAGVVFAILIDIIELEDPVHDGNYLCEKLLEVTDRLGITCAIISITRDNASPNDTMLEMFEAVVEEKWEEMIGLERLMYCCKFNRIEGDVRCCAHIYNIAIQAGKLHLNY